MVWGGGGGNRDFGTTEKDHGHRVHTVKKDEAGNEGGERTDERKGVVKGGDEMTDRGG